MDLPPGLTARARLRREEARDARVDGFAETALLVEAALAVCMCLTRLAERVL